MGRFGPKKELVWTEIRASILNSHTMASPAAQQTARRGTGSSCGTISLRQLGSKLVLGPVRNEGLRDTKKELCIRASVTQIWQSHGISLAVFIAFSLREATGEVSQQALAWDIHSVTVFRKKEQSA